MRRQFMGVGEGWLFVGYHTPDGSMLGRLDAGDVYVTAAQRDELEATGCDTYWDGWRLFSRRPGDGPLEPLLTPDGNRSIDLA